MHNVLDFYRHFNSYICYYMEMIENYSHGTPEDQGKYWQKLNLSEHKL